MRSYADGYGSMTALIVVLVLLFVSIGVKGDVVVYPNATEIWKVVSRDMLLRQLYNLGVDDVALALSFLGHRLTSQSGLPWVALQNQDTAISQIAQAVQQLSLYPPSSFVSSAVPNGYIAPLPAPWERLLSFLKDFKLTSGTGHGCPEFTNLIYDRQRHTLECVAADSATMTISCEGESTPWIFTAVISSITLVIVIVLFIATVVIFGRAADELQHAVARDTEETEY